jgi:hypothetical protein
MAAKGGLANVKMLRGICDVLVFCNVVEILQSFNIHLSFPPVRLFARKGRNPSLIIIPYPQMQSNGQ